MVNAAEYLKPGKRGRRLRSLLLLAALPGLLSTGGGCTRRFFRNRADEEVASIMAEKDKYPDWQIEDYYVYPNPRSRNADWTNPDRPPMPPDDPAAYNLAPRPQKPGHAGVQYIEGTGYLDLMAEWDKENRARLEAARGTENPEEEGAGDPVGQAGETKTPAQLAREREVEIERELAVPVSTSGPLPVPPEMQRCKPYLLNLEQTVELGFLCSREFQTVRENLYLTALPVTAERFSFIAQPYLADQLIRQRAGSQTPGPQNAWINSSALGFTKLFSTGALLLANFANQTVYNLGMNPGPTSVSTVSLDFIQPFLRGGGRAVALEPLTQAERNLLYAIRDFYRFRQEYFVFFAAGSPNFIPGISPGVVAIQPGTVSPAGPFVAGGTFTPPAIAGATAGLIGLGAFNNAIGTPATVQVTPGASGRLGPVFTSILTPQGYLATIGEKAQLVNTYKNIQALERFLRLFRVYLDGGLVNQVQVNAIQQQLLSSRATALTSQSNYRISLDQLKQQLGVPMTVPIDLDVGPLQPVIDVADRYENVTASFESATNRSLSYGRAEEVARLRERYRRLFRTSGLVRGTRFAEAFPRRWAFWENLSDDALTARLKELLAEQRKLLTLQDTLQSKEQQLSEADQRRLNELTAEIDVGAFEQNLRTYMKEPWQDRKDPLLRQRAQARAFGIVHRSFLAVLEVPFADQFATIRSNWPELPPLCVDGVDLLRADEDEALAVLTRAGLSSRLDLMNQRAQVVDAWRKIRVAANALMGTVTVDYHIDSSTPAGQARPFAFAGSRTTNQLVFNFSPPLVRILERNNYRSALINYQQIRRNLMINEDQVVFEARFQLRQLRALANNYQNIQRTNIQLAYVQVDQALQQFAQPLAPPGTDLPGFVGPTTPRPQAQDPAALTTQLLNAQNSLLSAQNNLYSTWIGYLTTRMNFYRDLGVMPLDSRGVWIDAAASCDCQSPRRQPDEQPGREPPAGDGGERPERLPEPRPLPPAAGAAVGDGG
jgi:outer membrane protein TolC